MPIPAAQLSIWMNRGGTTASENAYAAICRALAAPHSVVQGHDYELFLQGSYRNATNIYGDSDIDVVLALNETIITNSSELPPSDQLLIPRGTRATYPIESFRQDVVTSLRATFGTVHVREGTRAVTAPCSVNTYGRYLECSPRFKITVCDLKTVTARASSRVTRNVKSLGNRSAFRRTA